MNIVKFRNKNYQKTVCSDNHYLLTMIFNNNNNWHQLKINDDGVVDKEYIFRWGNGSGHREGILIKYI